MNIDFQKLVIQKHVIDSSTHEKSKKLSVAYGVDRNFFIWLWHFNDLSIGE